MKAMLSMEHEPTSFDERGPENIAVIAAVTKNGHSRRHARPRGSRSTTV